MATNRSVPTDTVLPHITYQNVADALAWLTTTFGFTEHYRYGEADGRISGAQLAKIRAESVRRSEANLRGRISEELAPLAPDFPFAPADARFIGTPIDFIVFDGYGEVRAGSRESLRSIVFVEVKTGRGSLTTVQRRVRNCLEAGGVSCRTLASYVEVAGG